MQIENQKGLRLNIALALTFLGIMVSFGPTNFIGPGSLYTLPQDNFFPSLAVFSKVNTNVLTLIPYLLFPLSFLFLWGKKLKIVSLLIVFVLFAIVQLNQTLLGIDTAVYSLFFLALICESRSLASRKNIFVIGLFSLYFFSALAKMQRPEWTQGEVITFLLQSNISLYMWEIKYSFFTIIFKFMTYLILLAELSVPLCFFSDRLFRFWNIAFALIHLGSFLTLRIPHLSYFLMSVHLYIALSGNPIKNNE